MDHNRVNFDIIEASEKHIPLIVEHMRQMEVDELWSLAAMLPRKALQLSLENAEKARTWLINSVPAAMGGVTEDDIIWLVTTDLVDEHPRRFLLEAQRQFKELREGHERLFNFVSSKNARTIRWLQWMGFKMGPEMLMGVFRMPFRHFEWRISYVH